MVEVPAPEEIKLAALRSNASNARHRKSSKKSSRHKAGPKGGVSLVSSDEEGRVFFVPSLRGVAADSGAFGEPTARLVRLRLEAPCQPHTPNTHAMCFVPHRACFVVALTPPPAARVLEGHAAQAHLAVAVPLGPVARIDLALWR